MDPDEVIRLVEELKLSSQLDADSVLKLGSEALRMGEERIGNCLVAKVFSSKAINRVAFVNHISRILQANNHIEVGFLGDNIFWLDFKSLQDRRRAIAGGPWNFFRDLIIFREPRGLQTPSMLNFDDISIWVQCYNIPLILMHKIFLEKVGSMIGTVEEIDTRDNGFAMGRYARIKVRLNINHPLKKHVRVHVNQEEEEIIILLSYERLPDFCHNCGCIGHSFRDCKTTPMEKGKLSYGNWLKAPNRGDGAKHRPHSPTKSNGKSAMSPTTSSTRDIDELLANNNYHALILQQSKTHTEKGNSVMTTGQEFRKEPIHISEDAINESRLLQGHQQNHIDTCEAGKSSELAAHSKEGIIQCKKPNGKKWKPLARDKGTQDEYTLDESTTYNDQGKEHATYTGNYSHTRKRTMETDMDMIDNAESAVVAKQPRRHQ